MRALVQNLLAFETREDPASNDGVHAAQRVIEKLRITLTRFSGAEGYSTLLRRALAIASADLPSLSAVQVTAEGTLNGLESVVADGDGEVAIAIATHLLDLLVTFIGKPLTLRLVREAWPDVSLE